MKYCIFAGTFNPVHNAHLTMAQRVIKVFGFDKIIFIPAYMQPFKNFDTCKNSALHRLEMLKLALNDKPQFEISAIEFERKDISYTYTTVLELYQTLPDIEERLNFIIGTDAFLNIHKWKEAEKLVKLLNFILLVRDENELEKCKSLKNVQYTILKTDKINISSTMIREMVKSNEDIGALVPEKVRKYIEEKGLYRD